MKIKAGQANLLSELRADLGSSRMLKAMAASFLIAAIVVIQSLALSTIVFGGPLLSFAVQGAGMMLFGAMAMCLLIGVISSYPGVIGLPQEVPATVLGTLGAAIVASTVEGPGNAAFMTMAALLVLSSLLTGAFFVAVGYFRLANFFRFIPYPVAGGFFAGTGCLLVMASISVMSGVTVDWPTLPRLLDADVVWKWAPGVVYGAVLILVVNRTGSFLAMLGSFIIVGALYHLGLLFFDISLQEAKARSLLLAGISQEGAPWPAFGIGDLLDADWAFIAAHTPELLATTLVTLLCLLVYVNGLEVATGVEVDLDREFRAAGIAGICAAAGGSASGCQSFGLTLPFNRLGVDTPWLGIAVAIVLGLCLFFGTGLLELLPVSIIGGVLFFIGGDLMFTWLFKAQRWLHWTDYGIIVLICIVIAAFGFIEGVGMGMVATLVLFAFRLSRVEVVAQEFTGRQRSSTRIRSIPDRAILLERGNRLRVYRLRGYIFFGTAHRLVDRLKGPMREAQPPACIVLDFEAVSGCDFSAIDLLRQFARSIEGETKLTICAASAQLEANLRSHLTAADRGIIQFERDLDHGLESGEDALLALASDEFSQAPRDVRGHLLDRVADDLERHLGAQIVFEALIEQLRPWLAPREFASGDMLAERGHAQDGAHFLISGQVSVHGPEGKRMYQCGPGAVLEPWAAFSEHEASFTAVARTPCRTMVLDPKRRELLEADDNDLTLKLFAFLIRSRSSPGALFPQTGVSPR